MWALREVSTVIALFVVLVCGQALAAGERGFSVTDNPIAVTVAQLKVSTSPIEMCSTTKTTTSHVRLQSIKSKTTSFSRVLMYMPTIETYASKLGNGTAKHIGGCAEMADEGGFAGFSFTDGLCKMFSPGRQPCRCGAGTMDVIYVTDSFWDNQGMLLPSVTFEFIASVYFSFTTLTTPQSMAAMDRLTCGMVCGQHGTCGGIVWDTGKTPSCQLVVDPSEPGAAVSTSTSAYRVANYRDGLLQQMVPLDITWQAAKSFCEANCLELLPYPVSPKERAILSIRPTKYTYVDVVRRTSDGAFVDGQGRVVPETAFNWGGTDPNNEGCLGVGYNPLAYFDYPCNAGHSGGQVATYCVG